MEWFGPTWEAPVNEAREVPAPLGAICGYHDCGDPVLPFDRGIQIPMILDEGEDPNEFYAFWFEPGAAAPGWPNAGGWRIAFHIDCFLHSVVGPVFPESMDAPLRNPS